MYLLWSTALLSKNKLSAPLFPFRDPVWKSDTLSNGIFILVWSIRSKTFDMITVKKIPLYFSRSRRLPLFLYIIVINTLLQLSGILHLDLIIFSTCNNVTGNNVRLGLADTKMAFTKELVCCIEGLLKIFCCFRKEYYVIDKHETWDQKVMEINSNINLQ